MPFPIHALLPSRYQHVGNFADKSRWGDIMLALEVFSLDICLEK